MLTRPGALAPAGPASKPGQQAHNTPHFLCSSPMASGTMGGVTLGANSMLPMDRKTTTTLTIEYTARGKRVVKIFTNPYQARSFFTFKDKVGAAPRIVAGQTR